MIWIGRCDVSVQRGLQFLSSDPTRPDTGVELVTRDPGCRVPVGVSRTSSKRSSWPCEYDRNHHTQVRTGARHQAALCVHNQGAFDRLSGVCGETVQRISRVPQGGKRSGRLVVLLPPRSYRFAIILTAEENHIHAAVSIQAHTMLAAKSPRTKTGRFGEVFADGFQNRRWIQAGDGIPRARVSAKVSVAAFAPYSHGEGLNIILTRI